MFPFFQLLNESVSVFMGVIVELNNTDQLSSKDNFYVEKKPNNSYYCEKSVTPEPKFSDCSVPVFHDREEKCVKDYLKSKMKGLKKLKRKMGFGKLFLTFRLVPFHFQLRFQFSIVLRNSKYSRSFFNLKGCLIIF